MNTARGRESGNVFFTLFGAIALVGVVGVATATLMRGPVGTMVSLNERTKADTELQIARKLVALDATQVEGDCDSDGFIEPAPPDKATGSCGTMIAGGGCIPAGIGAAKTDAWGTMVGYCAWNHGPKTSGSGCSADLLQGTNGTTKTVIALVSAGPDRIFQTSCADDPGYVAKGGDDLVEEWTFDEAQTLSGGGLWSLESGNPNAITTTKSVDISKNSTFASGTTATFQGNASFGTGSALNMAGGGLFMLPDETKAGACNAANSGLLRRDTGAGTKQILQICNGTAPAWVDVGGAGATPLKIDDLSDAVSDIGGGLNLFLGENGGNLIAGALQNVAVGINAGMNVTSGKNNTLIGYNAGHTITNETNDILIGDNVDITAGQSNRMNIGNLLYGNAGNVGIGVATPGSTLDVGGTLHASGNANLGGTLGVSGAATLNSTLAVSGATVLQSTLDAQGTISNSVGNVSIADSLDVSGPTALSNTLNVTGITTLNSTLEVTSTTTLDSDLSVAGHAAVTGDVSGLSFQLSSIGSGVGVFSDGAAGLALDTAAVKRIEIAAGGKVGIGIAAPAAELDVAGAVKVGQDASVCGIAIYGAIRYDSSSDKIQVCSNTNSWVTIGTSGGGGGGASDFWTQIAAPDLRLYYILADVGIGTNDPKAPLHVNGDMLVTGGYTGTAAVAVTGAGTRMFFEPVTSSFRAGTVTGSDWDNGSIGNYSTAFGQDTTASGVGSMSWGQSDVASGTLSTAWGLGTTAKGGSSTAFGQYTLASGGSSTALGQYVYAGDGVAGDGKGDYSLAIGLTNTSTANYAQVTGTGALGIFMGDQHGQIFAASNTMGLFGGQMIIDPNAPATLLAPPRAGLGLTVNGDVGANQYCDAAGNNCFVPGSGGSISAAGSDREVQYNSGGKLGADAGLVYTSAGHLGIGVVAPTAKLEINTPAGDSGLIINNRNGTRTFWTDEWGEVMIGGAGNWGTLNVAGKTFLFDGGPGNYANPILDINVNAAQTGNLIEFDKGGTTIDAFDGNGRLAIGQPIPATALDVAGTIRVADGGETCAAGVAGGIRYTSVKSLQYCNSTKWTTLTGIGAVGTAAGNNGDLQFNSGGLLGANANFFWDDVSGSLGIGSATPTDKLDVVGNIRAQGPNGWNANGQVAKLVFGTDPGGAGGEYGIGYKYGTGLVLGVYKLGGASGSLGANSLDAITILETSGNVGIGTAAPGEMLFLSGGNMAATGKAGSGPALSESGAGTRMFWYPKAGAFRAGGVAGAKWDDANVGNYSAAFGYDTKASGSSSMAWGQGGVATNTEATAWGDYTFATGTLSTAWGSASVASGLGATAWGLAANASGDYSTALGKYVQTGNGTAGASGNYALAIGLTNTNTANYAEVDGNGSLGIFMQDQHNKVLAANNTMALLGGKFVLDPNSQATLLTAAANTALDVNGNIGAIQYCDINGANCFVPGSGGTVAAAGLNTQIQFNSGGNLGASADFTWNGFLNINDSRFGGGIRNAIVIQGNNTDEALGINNTSAGGNIWSVVSSGAGSALGAGTLSIGEDVAGNLTQRLGIDSGGDFSINSNQLFVNQSNGDVGIGTATPGAALDVQTAQAAASGVAYGVRQQQTLTAAADNDTLYSLYLNSTYNDNGKANVVHTDIGFNGTGANPHTQPRTIALDRNMTAGKDGYDLSITAGGAHAGDTDMAGGDLILAAGTSTGNAGSNISLRLAGCCQGGGVADRTPREVMRLNTQLGVQWQASTANAFASTAWGDGGAANGGYSTAFGMFTTTSGEAATAWGNTTTASGDMATAWGGYYNGGLNGGTASGIDSTAWGILTMAAGTSSTAFGQYAQAGDTADTNGNYSLAIGLTNTNGGAGHYPKVTGNGSYGIFMQNQSDKALAANNTMALLGGKFVLDPNSPATLLAANANTDMDVNGNIGAVNYCDVNGTNCFTAASVSSGAIGAAGADKQIQFNSGGKLGANANFVWDRTNGRLGIGTAAPGTTLEVSDAGGPYIQLDKPDDAHEAGILINKGAVSQWAIFSDNTFPNAGEAGDLKIESDAAGESDALTRIHLPVSNKNIYLAESGGNVGINTRTPGEMLFLSGGNLAATGKAGSGAALSESGAGTRMIWYPKAAAFRAGGVAGAKWDDANVGNYSAAFGYDTKASGSSSMAWGQGGVATNTEATAWGDYTFATGTLSTAWGSASVASGLGATAWGLAANASGDYSTALGKYVQTGNGTAGASGNYALAIGLTNTNTANYAEVDGNGSLGIFMQDQHNKILAANNTMGLFGGKFVLDPNSPATLLAANANTDMDVNGNIGAVNYCDVAGANCFTAASVTGAIAGAVPGAPNKSVQFNSGGTFGGSANFTWDNTNNRLGIGAATPLGKLDVVGPDGDAGGENYFTGTPTLSLRNSGGSNIVYMIAGQWSSSQIRFGYPASVSEGEFGFDNGSQIFSFVGGGSSFTTTSIDTINQRVGIGNGAATPGAGLDIQSAQTAASGVAYGVRQQQTITAAADNDALYGLYLNTAFADATHAGVTHTDIGINGTGSNPATQPRTIVVDRNATAATGGYGLSIGAGGAYKTGNDLSGGDLILQGGTSTGNASSNISFRVAGQNQGSGAADRAPVEIMKILGVNDGVQWGSSSAPPSATGWAATAWGGGTSATGNGSTAFGAYSTASGASSVAWGGDSGSGLSGTASGDRSTAWGLATTAAGTNATAFGQYVMAGDTANTNGNYSLAIGLTNTSTATYAKVTGNGSLGIFMQDQHNKVLAANNTMALLGGKFVLDPNSPATLLAANANTDMDVNGNIGAVNYCDVAGANCFTAASVSGAITGAVPGAPVNSVQFNSGGKFAGSTNLTWDKTNNRLGIGTAAPVDTFSIATAPVADATRALVNLSNTALSGGSTDGTYLGLNAPGGYTGDFINLQVNGSPQFIVNSTGASADAYYVNVGIAAHGYFANSVSNGGMVFGTPGTYTTKVYSGSGGDVQLGVDGNYDDYALVVKSTTLDVGLDTDTPAAGLDIQTAQTAASGVAYGLRQQQTITAAADNDALYGLYLNTTYADATHNNVTHTDIGFNGAGAAPAPRVIAVDRNTTAATGGFGLTIGAGGAYKTGTDLNGGSLVLSAGTSTGAGSSDIVLQTTGYETTTGAGDNIPTQMMKISGTNGGVSFQGATASGQYGTAFGYGTNASNRNSMVWGDFALASGSESTAWGNGTVAAYINTTAFGQSTTASGTSATAFGQYVKAGNGTGANGKGDWSLAIGLTNTNTASYPEIDGSGDMMIVMQDQHNKVLSANNTMALLGGKFVLDPNSPATLLAANANTDMDVNGNIGAVNYCDVNGTNCFTAASIATGATGAAGSDTQIQFNSGGRLWASGNLTWNGGGVTSPTFLGSYSSDVAFPPFRSSTDDNTGLYFPSADNLGLVTGGVEKLRILANGNVGIGTTSPTQALEVNGSIRIGASTNGTGLILAPFSNNGVFGLTRNATNDTLYIGPTGNGSLQFNQNGTYTFTINAGNTTGMVIGNTGLVGIGMNPTGLLTFGGRNFSTSAWGTNGIAMNGATATYTDTSSSGTVANAVGNSFAAPTFAASSATTYTTGSTLYVAGPPTTGANVTITNPYAMYVNGNSFINGVLRFTANTGISGNGNQLQLISGGTTNAFINLGSMTLGQSGQSFSQSLGLTNGDGGQSNYNGGTLTIYSGQGTGTGTGGPIVFQIANTGSSGTSLNALGTAFTIASPNSGTTAVVNGLTLTGMTTGNAVTLAARGGDTNIGLKLDGKGTGDILLQTLGTGKVGIGITTPTADLHLKAGTAAAGTAPLKLTAGVNLTTPEDGAVEYDGTHFYATIGSTRYQLDQQMATGPNAFSFTDQAGVTTSTTVTSNVVTLTGYSGSLTATCTNCTAIARNGSWGGTTMAGFNAGDTIAIRLTSSASAGTAATATATVGGTTSGTWTVTTASAAGPAAFSFTDVTNATTGITYTSNTVTLTGFTGPVSATCNNCTGIARNGVWGVSPMTGFVNNDTIAIRQTSSPGAGVATTAAVTVGTTTSGTWTVTTATACSVGITVGQACPDGTIYAGFSPDGNVPMYATVCDSNQYWNGSACTACASGQWSGSGSTCNTTYTRAWNNGTGNWTVTGYTSTTTGKANTAGLAALVDAGSPYNAADYCKNLSAYGHTDWYLPAKDELNVMYGNRAAIGTFDTTDGATQISGAYPGLYWTSTEYGTSYAWYQRFSDGYQNYYGKYYLLAVRCVRR